MTTTVSLLLMMLTFLYVGGRLEHLPSASLLHRSSPLRLQVHHSNPSSLLVSVTDGETSDKADDFFSGLSRSLPFPALHTGIKSGSRQATSRPDCEPAAGLPDGVTQALQTVVLMD